MSYDYGYSVSQQRSLWYYLIFPLDAWQKSSGGQGFDEQKSSEFWPILIFLLPLIVLAAGFFLRLGFFSSLFFYGIEAFCLALVSKFYGKIDDFGLVMELFFNYWVSFLALALCFMIGFAMLFIFF